MQRVQKWALGRWTADKAVKLGNKPIGTRLWWMSIKEQQGVTADDHVPPLRKEDGSLASNSKQKAEALAQYFSGKMQVTEPNRCYTLLLLDAHPP